MISDLWGCSGFCRLLSLPPVQEERKHREQREKRQEKFRVSEWRPRKGGVRVTEKMLPSARPGLALLAGPGRWEAWLSGIESRLFESAALER